MYTLKNRFTTRCGTKMRPDYPRLLHFVERAF